MRMILDVESLFPSPAKAGYNRADTAATAEILTKSLRLIGFLFEFIETLFTGGREPN